MADLTIIVPTLDRETGKAAIGRISHAAGCSVDFKLCVDEQAEGFTRTVNRGLRKATTRYVGICSDDVEPRTDNFLALMIEAIETHDRIGVITCTYPCRTPPISWADGPSPRPCVTLMAFVPYGCVAMRKEMLDEVGYLDERYTHYASDTDHQLRARAKGWQAGWAEHICVFREVHAPREPQWSEDRAIFRERWPGAIF